MKATLSELHKRPAQVLRTVKDGRPVMLTEHGKPVAVISPLPQPRKSGKEFADMLRRHLDKEDLEALQEVGELLAKNGNRSR